MPEHNVHLDEWLALALAPPRKAIYKRLSGNDTGATSSHQVGPYIPNRIAFALAPELDTADPNPRRTLKLRLVSHDEVSRPTLIYYNNRRGGTGTRDECRLTGFGGRQSAFQNPDNTGALVVISFDVDGAAGEAWLAASLEEEDIIEARLGAIEPGVVGYLGPDPTGTYVAVEERRRSDICMPAMADLKAAWSTSFPSPAELSAESARRVPNVGLTIDARLLRRHDCEFGLFRTVEAHHLTPAIGVGFPNVGAFLALAQSTLQRRKARAGKALELQLARIFTEEEVLYSAQAETELGHRPDFLFPSTAIYHAARAGDDALDMLAAKSTLRDRWRQVLREADKIPVKHLFTLDEGVSESQFRDIASAGVRLVVPAQLVQSFPRRVRPDLITLRAFVDRRRTTQVKPYPLPR